MSLVDDYNRRMKYTSIEADKRVEELKQEKIEKQKQGIYKHIPYPKKTLSLLIITTLTILTIQTWPTLINWIIRDYGLDNPNLTTLLNVSLGGNVLLLGFISLIWFNTRDATIPFLVASLLHRPVLPCITKNRRLKFIVPKDVHFNVWTINDDAAIEPDPDGILIGPNNIPCMLMLPEIAKGLNIRKLVEGKDINLDVTAYKQYAKWFEQKAWAKARTLSGGIMPYLPLILIMGIVVLFMYPTIEQRFDQSGRITACNTRLEACRLDLADHGIQPDQPENPKKEDLTILKPAQPDVSVGK